MFTIESPEPAGHDDVFRRAAEVLESGTRLELVGDSGSGRTHLIRRLGAHFNDLDWQVIEVQGISSLEFSPLLALAIAGLVDVPSDRSSALTLAFRDLEARIRGVRSVFLVDDADQLDNASWGLLCALSVRLDVPIGFTRARLRRGEPGQWSRGRLDDTITISVPPMGYSELQANLESSLGVTVAPATMSRLFAWSGGSIGVATSILKAGISAGAIALENDVLYPAGSLWTPSLRSIVEDMLRWLPTDDLLTLRTLALFGPVDLDSARRMVSEGALLRLEEAGYLEIAGGGYRGVALVHPPILAEYFRHETLPGQRAAAFASVDDSIDVESLLDNDSSTIGSSAMLVRLVHERTRQGSLNARQQWNDERSLPAATRLLAALDTDPFRTVDEVVDLIASADELHGSAAERADWEVALAFHIAYDDGEPARAVERLRRVAAELPAHVHRLEAEATGIEIASGALPEELPYAEVDLETLSRVDRITVLRTKCHWLLVQGRVREASALLEGRYSQTLDDARLDAVWVQVLISMGRIAEGLRLASRSLEEARQEFDGPRIRTYSLLGAWGEILRGSPLDVSVDLDEAIAVGTYPAEPSWAVVGLAMVNAYLALQDGEGDAARQLVVGTDGNDSSDAPMLGFQRAFLVEKLAEAEGDEAELYASVASVGDSLWERGAKLAAATIYLEGLRADPTVELWTLVSPRLAEIDSPTINRWGELFRAVFGGDAVAAVGIVRDARSSSEPPEAIRMASVALRALRRAGLGNEFPAAIEELEFLTEERRYRGRSDSSELTKQEYAIAELVATGFSNSMIAQTLLISARTVQSHVTEIQAKTGGEDRSTIREYLKARSPWKAE